MVLTTKYDVLVPSSMTPISLLLFVCIMWPYRTLLSVAMSATLWDSVVVFVVALVLLVLRHTLLHFIYK